jgi:hypothetical protein
MQPWMLAFALLFVEAGGRQTLVPNHAFVPSFGCPEAFLMRALPDISRQSCACGPTATFRRAEEVVNQPRNTHTSFMKKMLPVRATRRRNSKVLRVFALDQRNRENEPDSNGAPTTPGWNSWTHQANATARRFRDHQLDLHISYFEVGVPFNRLLLGGLQMYVSSVNR